MGFGVERLSYCFVWGLLFKLTSKMSLSAVVSINYYVIVLALFGSSAFGILIINSNIIVFF